MGEFVSVKEMRLRAGSGRFYRRKARDLYGEGVSTAALPGALAEGLPQPRRAVFKTIHSEGKIPMSKLLAALVAGLMSAAVFAQAPAAAPAAAAAPAKAEVKAEAKKEDKAAAKTEKKKSTKAAKADKKAKKE